MGLERAGGAAVLSRPGHKVRFYGTPGSRSVVFRTQEPHRELSVFDVMTRYHFHAADGATLRDAEGEELPTLEAAKEVALDIMADLLPMKRQAFWRRKMLSVSVKDESGRLVAVITTTATVDPVPRPEAPPEY